MTLNAKQVALNQRYTSRDRRYEVRLGYLSPEKNIRYSLHRKLGAPRYVNDAEQKGGA